MDTSYDSHLDLDDRRDELRPALRSRPAVSVPSFNKSFLFQHNGFTSSSTTTPAPCSNVQTLLLRNNQLTTLSPYADALYEMHQSLRELTLRNNAFTKVPPEILTLTNLTSLSLAKNQIQYIGLDLFPQLSQLTWLSLSHNHLESLPDDLASCHHLLGLDLSSNNFQVLPRAISHLSQLQVLLMQKNELERLPDGPEEPLPASLQTLNLAFNRFSQVPDRLVTNPPPSLTHLHLSGNALGELPPDFLKYGYKNLVSLDLHTCQLSRVPPLFFTYLDQTHSSGNNMIPLRRLNLAINQLRDLPSTIGLTTQLQWLNLNDNRLTTLPATMAHLVHLAKLGLVQNRIQFIPPHLFSRMLALEKIDLRRNQLSYLPPSILSLAPDHEIQQHIDLSVPITVFDANRVNQVLSNDTMSKDGEGGNGGGSLKTLLLYENIHLEQKDGIFASLEYDKEDNDESSDGKELEQEPKMWVPLINLEKLKSFSHPAPKNAAILGHRLQQQPPSVWTLDSNADGCHQEAVRFFFHNLPSLKNIALQQHLAQQQSRIDTNSSLRTTNTPCPLPCHQTQQIVSNRPSDRLDMHLETRHSFLSHSFPSWFPCLLQQSVLTDAQQCDNCHQWTMTLPFQVGYLARLCNNRMQVPVRYSVCSAWCALDATLRIQATADNWRTQRLDSAVHLPIPTTSTSNDDDSTFNNSQSAVTNAPPARHYSYHHSLPEPQPSNDNTKNQMQQNQTSPTATTSTLSSSSNNEHEENRCTASPSTRHDCQHEGHVNENDENNASVPSLTRVLRRVEQLAATLIQCATPQSQPQQQQQQQPQQLHQQHQASSSFTTSSQQNNIDSQPSSSLVPLHQPTYPATSTMIQRLSQLPTPPALPQDYNFRLTDPRPTITSFNHLPRDAIRLERF